MARFLKFLEIALIVFCTFPKYSFCLGCVFRSSDNSTYNLTALDWSWKAVGRGNGNDTTTYQIAICGSLDTHTSVVDKECANSSVCRLSNGRYAAMGKLASEEDVTIQKGYLKDSFMMFLNGSQCLTQNETNFHVFINFVCGRVLGAPEVFMESDCGVKFLWKTSAACSTSRKAEVPCYVIDDKGSKISLDGLSVRPANRVVPTHANPNVTIMISVCSSFPAGTCGNCSAQTAAYRIVGDKTQPIGQLASRLELMNEGLRLTYTSPASDQGLPEGCTAPPTTTVIFLCPAKLKNRLPRLLSDVNCQYEIEWETEYACPESMLKGDLTTCRFTKEVNGIDFDLSPLKKDKGFYEVKGGSNTTYIFNICGGLVNDSCNGTNAFCVNKADSPGVIDKANRGSLIWNEGVLSLKYEGPECSASQQQVSIFTFSCDPNAVNGTGYPQYISSIECTNYFLWDTKYACSSYKFEIPCSVSVGNKFFDLSRLQKTTGSVWEILSPGRVNNSSYYMNVCGLASRNFHECEGDPSIVKIDEVGKCINLGEFASSPFYDSATQSVRIEYTNGSICRENLRWTSTIEFKCHPGFLAAEISLTHVNEASCVNEFEFRTAAACTSTIFTGTNCSLMDPSAGIKLDLSPLKSSSFEFHATDRTFFLSICDPLPTNNTCVKHLNTSLAVAACSLTLNESDPVAQNLGSPSSQIGYRNGVVNLTYTLESSSGVFSLRTINLFACSHDMENGTKIYYHGNPMPNTYVFRWHTPLACPEAVSTECFVSDSKTGRQYDLSQLLKSETDWSVHFTENDGKKRKLYFNICRTLNSAPLCERDAAACISTIGDDDKESVFVSNAGRATIKPQLSSDDHLQLTYSHGGSCTAFGEASSYSTIIHFLCSDHEMEGPRFLGRVGACQYTFLWTTKAACPSEIISVQNECVLTDPETGFIFDLTSLNHGETPLNVSAKDQTYKLNICGPVTNGCSNDTKSQSNVSVCEIKKDGEITVLGTSDNFTLQYVQGRDLVITYQNKIIIDSKEGGSSKVVVALPCDKNVTPGGQLNFIEKRDETHYLELKTPLSCVERVANCTFYDNKGNQYDLTILFQTTKNWEVHNPRLGSTGNVYHINFCRPLVKVPDYTCPGGATGACQTNLTSPHKSGISLGSQQAVPTVSKDSIVIRFTNGSKCEAGFRSASVNLFCSHTQGKLVFVTETPDCEYIFSMDTPAACSLQTARGENCIVRDPIYGHTVNLNNLKNKNYTAVDGEYDYVIRVCEELDGFSGSCAKSSACQTKRSDPNFSKSLGVASSKLMYSQGIITLSYENGDICHKMYNRTTTIKFTCKHPSESIEERPYFISEAEDCTYLFEWPTRYACPPFEVSECTAVDGKGQLFDLSDLSLPNSNYYVRNLLLPNQTFVINVCRSVVYSQDSLCPYKSASCVLDPSNSDPLKRALDIGKITRPPYFDNGRLVIKYSGGDSCNLKNDPSHFMESIIEFTCDAQKIRSEPVFIGQDGCTYHFIWSTAFACPIIDAASHDGCTAIDPITGFMFNLTSLMKKEPYRVAAGDHQYFLNVCGDVKNKCPGKAGVCQQELSGTRNWTVGISNSELQYHHDRALFLNYSGGDSCHNNTYQRNAIIQFHCSMANEGPNFHYESSDCTYYFTWGTELACQSQVHCALRNGSDVFDLIPLMEYPYFEVESHLYDEPSTSFYISVCGALGNVPGASCPVGSAVCRFNISTGQSQSLGRVALPPFIDFEGHATIIYSNGSQCKDNDFYKSRIIFNCDPDGGMGYPVLVNRDDSHCLYVFLWRTNLLCDLKTFDGIQVPGCTFTDNSTGIHFDLSTLKNSNSYQVEHGESTFLLNVCDPVGTDGCSNSAVCLRNGDGPPSSFGTASSRKFYYVGDTLSAVFTDGDDCPAGENQKKVSEILFTCNPDGIGIGTPKLLTRYTCHAVFTWETSVVCTEAHQFCSFFLGKKYFDFHLLSSLSHNWKAVDSKNTTYFLNLCRGLNLDIETKGCPPNAAICMKENTTVQSLGLVSNMTRRVNGSGELVLMYRSRSPDVCTSIHSHVSPLESVSEITFKCGSKLGEPKIVSGPDKNCHFHFVWETSLVCDESDDVLVYENNGTLHDTRLNSDMDLSEILNRTFSVSGDYNNGDSYVYVINLGQGYETAKGGPCFGAAVCQTKPKDPSHFRDIGTVSSRNFYIRGSELYLSFVSLTKGCGKNPNRNVTTLFMMQCSVSAGVGTPEFLYESSHCDYLFSWDTRVVCPYIPRLMCKGSLQKMISLPECSTRDQPEIAYSTFSVLNQRLPTQHLPIFWPSIENPPSAAVDDSGEVHASVSASHSSAVIIAVLVIILISCPIVYIVSKKERRSAAAAKIRNVFHHVTLPQFRYRRADGEALILINSAQGGQSDLFKDDDLLS